MPTNNPIAQCIPFFLDYHAKENSAFLDEFLTPFTYERCKLFISMYINDNNAMKLRPAPYLFTDGNYIALTKIDIANMKQYPLLQLQKNPVFPIPYSGIGAGDQVSTMKRETEFYHLRTTDSVPPSSEETNAPRSKMRSPPSSRDGESFSAASSRVVRPRRLR